MNYEDIDKARKILKLDETSNVKEIKDSYRRLANMHHPDKKTSASTENDAIMKELNWAYKILLDYCSDYRYSFKEDAVARTYPYEEKIRKWNENWFDSI